MVRLHVRAVWRFEFILSVARLIVNLHKSAPICVCIMVYRLGWMAAQSIVFNLVLQTSCSKSLWAEYVLEYVIMIFNKISAACQVVQV